MQVNFVRVYGLNDFDFDALYDGSEPDIYLNHTWSHEPLGRSKKEVFRYTIEQAFNLGVSADNEPLFGFKLTIDGVDHLVNIGYIESDGETYRANWFLTKPYNGSRSFIFDSNTSVVRAQFYSNNNITHYKFYTRSNAPIYQAFTNKTTINVVEDQQNGTEGNILKIQP